jgi:hypothetical protein
MKIFLICLALLSASPAFAETCKYQGADGRIIYTNIPMKGAKKLSCFGSDGSAKDGGSTAKPGSAAQPSPANFPRIDTDTQKQRDETRRKVLAAELETEQKALEQAKQDYADGESNPEVFHTADGKVRRNVVKFEEKMKKLQENVDVHEKNIQMLQKELAGIK